MTEIEQLRKDIATMEASMLIATRLNADVSYHNLKGLKRELQDQIAKLEAEAAEKADPWAEAIDKIENAERIEARFPGTVIYMPVIHYARHLQMRIAELQAGLAKRPVVYCLRELPSMRVVKTGDDVDVYVERHARQFNPIAYEIEPYTGEQS